MLMHEILSLRAAKFYNFRESILNVTDLYLYSIKFKLLRNKDFLAFIIYIIYTKL